MKITRSVQIVGGLYRLTRWRILKWNWNFFLSLMLRMGKKKLYRYQFIIWKKEFCFEWILQIINIDVFFSWKFRRLHLMEQHWRYEIVIRQISFKITKWFQSLNCSNQYILKSKLKLNKMTRLLQHIADYQI